MKPGWQTTEFWFNVTLFVGGIIMLTIGAATENKIVAEIGGLCLGASGLGYSISRGLSKRGEGGEAARVAGATPLINGLLDGVAPFLMGGAARVAPPPSAQPSSDPDAVHSNSAPSPTSLESEVTPTSPPG
jgi:hypothetical protein